MKKDEVGMFVLMFFSASLVMAGGIATGMEWLSAKGGGNQDHFTLMLSILGILGMGVWGVLRSIRQRVFHIEETLRSKQ